MGRRHGVHAIDTREHDDIVGAVRLLTAGRGADSVIDAVGKEAHGAPLGKLAHQLAGLLPDPVAAKVTEKARVDRLSVLHTAIDAVRRGGTISVSGVYGGMVDPMPMMDLFDKQIHYLDFRVIRVRLGDDGAGSGTVAVGVRIIPALLRRDERARDCWISNRTGVSGFTAGQGDKAAARRAPVHELGRPRSLIPGAG